MFVWLRLLGGIEDSYDLIMTKALKENVLAIPGIAFMPNRNVNPYVRVSFSNVTKENMDEALRRLAGVIDKEAAINNGDKKELETCDEKRSSDDLKEIAIGDIKGAMVNEDVEGER
jgi:hypothetical protein